jgi:predicted transcriptional regulator
MQKKEMKNLKINEDFEREFLKDYVYLQEESHELDKQIQEEINKFRKPAAIFIVDTDKILERDEVRHNVLPF